MCNSIFLLLLTIFNYRPHVVLFQFYCYFYSQTNRLIIFKHELYRGSHLKRSLFEVKQQWARLVLGWVPASVHSLCLMALWLTLVDRNPFGLVHLVLKPAISAKHYHVDSHIYSNHLLAFPLTSSKRWTFPLLSCTKH